MTQVTLDLVVGMTIHDEQIGIAVVVVVEEFYAPSAHETGDSADAGWTGHFVEREITIVLINRIHFVVDVGDKKVLPAIVVEIGGIDAHAGARPALLAESHAGIEANVRECAVLFVKEEKIFDGIVGDEKVHPSVVVDVGGDDAPGLAKGFSHARLFGNVGEGSVAIVVE